MQKIKPIGTNFNSQSAKTKKTSKEFRIHFFACFWNLSHPLHYSLEIPFANRNTRVMKKCGVELILRMFH